MELTEGEQWKKGTEVFEAVSDWEFPNLMSDYKPQNQEVQRKLNMINIKKSIPWHIIFKLQEIKKNPERNQREKNTLPIKKQNWKTTLDLSEIM